MLLSEVLQLDEDFGMGVGAPVGADQGIPYGGDGKAVVPCYMGMNSRFGEIGKKASGFGNLLWPKRRKKKKVAKLNVFKQVLLNYSAIYWQIVNNAEKREYPDGYYEMHHIIPRSEGGSNKKLNKVRLTAKEHHLCHLCLIKLRRCLKYCFRHLSIREYVKIKQLEQANL